MNNRINNTSSLYVLLLIIIIVQFGWNQAERADLRTAIGEAEIRRLEARMQDVQLVRGLRNEIRSLEARISEMESSVTNAEYQQFVARTD